MSAGYTTPRDAGTRCDNCGGTGTVWAEYEGAQFGRQEIENDCGRCGGTGRPSAAPPAPVAEPAETREPEETIFAALQDYDDIQNAEHDGTRNRERAQHVAAALAALPAPAAPGDAEAARKRYVEVPA